MGGVIKDSDLSPITGWAGGINNTGAETGAQDAVRDAVNVDFRADGKFSLRAGYRKVLAGANVHSLFSHPSFPFALVRVGPQLLSIEPDYVTTVIASGLGYQRASYAELNGAILWTVEGVATGRLDSMLNNHSLGVPSPDGIHALIADTNGGLDAGVYQVAITYSRNGEEGGCSAASQITIADNGAIRVDLPNPPSEIDTIRVWASEADGGVLYHVFDIPAGIAEVLVTKSPRGKAIETQFLQPLPAGHLLRVLNGIPWMAVQNQVYYSDPMRPGMHHPGFNRFAFQTKIEMMQPVGDAEGAGMYIASGGRTFWLAGATPKAASQRIAYPYGAVPGTGLTVPGSMFGQSSPAPHAYWMAKNGVPCLGTPGGVVLPLTDKTVAMHRFERGASLLREVAGVRSIVTAGQGGGVSPFGTSDKVAVRHYRNGIVVP
jgi:hypothetical protein